MKTLLEVFENELDQTPNILNQTDKKMKNTNTTANLLALAFVGLVSVIFFAFVISPILGVGLVFAGAFNSFLYSTI
jgi:uncharacterized protein YqhQ